MGEITEGETVRPKTKAGEFRRQDHDLSSSGMNRERENLARGLWGREYELGFRHRLEATGADIAPNAAAVLVESGPLDIRPELALRLPLGEANVVAAHRPLATYITFRHNFTLPDARLGGVQSRGGRFGRLNIS